MSKNIILCFDGTCNEPSDAEQKTTRSGGIEDGNITNVLKLHLLFGGDLRGGSLFEDQVSCYYPGVGTYGSRLRRIYNTAFAPDHQDVGKIIIEGVADLQRLYVEGDEIFVFGFSRGAAIARRFCSVLPKHFHGTPPRIRFLGVFDTVASMGKPNLRDSRKPVSDVFFENKTIAPGIQEALHLVALDEKRKAFMPTLMNRDPRVTEIWFPGAHADVGGGYRLDGLSDGALQFMLEEITRRSLDLGIVSPTEIDYLGLSPKRADWSIDFDDVIIEPDIFGHNHVQHRPPLTAKLTLADRDLRVNIRDRESRIPAVIHHSVADRVHGDRDYRPASLRRTKHQVLYPDGTLESFEGLRDHLERGVAPLRALKVNEAAEVIVHANLRYNRSGLLIERDARYLFQVEMAQEWMDGDITCGPGGWNRTMITKGWREAFIKVAEGRRREPEAEWFELLGSIGESDRHVFRVLRHGSAAKAWKAPASGELCSFANDLESKYGNNIGAVRFKVRRVG
jgi:hypothetical protein